MISVEEAETRADAATAVALMNTKIHAAFEGQSSNLIANIDALTEAIADLEEGTTGGGFLQNGEIVGSLKQLKGETSADLTALQKEELDRKTKHQGLMKAETQPRPARPPPWRRCDRGRKFVCGLLSLCNRHEDRRPLFQHSQCLPDGTRPPWKRCEGTDEDGFLSCSMMIRAKNIIMKERIWINPVTSKFENSAFGYRH